MNTDQKPASPPPSCSPFDFMKTPRTDEMIESRRHRGMTLEFAIRLCRELETENASLRDALGEIAGYDKLPFQTDPKEGICPYGCDTPHIAQNALANAGDHPPR